MSAIDAIALASPILPVALLFFALRSERALDALAPLQFATLLGGAILAIAAAHAAYVGGAAATVLIGAAGLFATVLRKDHIAHRAAHGFDWEKFERDLQFYAIVSGHR